MGLLPERPFVWLGVPLQDPIPLRKGQEMPGALNLLDTHECHARRPQEPQLRASPQVPDEVDNCCAEEVAKSWGHHVPIGQDAAE